MDVRFTYDINGILEVDVTVVSTKEHFSKVIVNKNIHLTPEQIEERRKERRRLRSIRESRKRTGFCWKEATVFTKKTPEKSENIWTRSWQIFQLH